MSEHFQKELFEAIYDIRDRVTRIEERITKYEKLEEKVDKVDEKANEAVALANENHRSLQDLKRVNLWAWGFIITLAIGLITSYLTK